MSCSTQCDVVPFKAEAGTLDERIKGWTCDEEEVAEIGKKRQIVASVYRKGKLMVYKIDESEDGESGWHTIIADNRAALEEMLKDLGLNSRIEEGVAVHQFI